ITELQADVGNLPPAIAEVAAFIHSRPFVKYGWIKPSKKKLKLYRASYVDLLCQWFGDLPTEIKKYAPIDLIAKHVQKHTESFIEVAKQCEAWQTARDPGNVRLLDRRAQSILRRAERHQHVLGIPGHVFLSDEWKRVADKTHPLSEKEWKTIKEYTLKLLRKDQVLGGVRVADVP
ncbi:hypothetical protein FRC01_003227, partial [Tulasnella sp. 417]